MGILAKIRKNVRVILFDNSGSEIRFLLLLARKGYWQFPQGGIELNEDEITAARREVLEETGLRIRGIDVLKKSKVKIDYYAERAGEPIRVNLVAFAAKCDSSKAVKIGQSEDMHEDWKWVGYKQVKELLTKFPEQKKVFLEVCKKANLDV